MNAVELRDVTKTFGRVVAVDDLSLDVPRGSVYGFIGPNGSGKTTTLRMIMNLYYPDRGTIRVFGDVLHGACTDRIGYMPEERGLYKRMKVRDVLRFYGELKNGRDVRGEVDRWLERLELGAWAKAKVEALSKGMAQKVQFIATVVSRPELVILDEPFTGLDPVNTDAIREAVLELQAGGTTVIFSTHDMGVAERMCDFIFMIFKGRKVLDGTLAAIQDRYGSDTVRVRTEDGAAVLQQLEGVEKVTDFGRVQELRIARDRDPQEIVRAIVARTRVESFEIARPSLHDIFVRIAGPEAREADDA
ncbi:MAG: ATP-binding cassette domain-containing protein [Gemmatimonadales bacterium]|jgi:ABC-2 type transport system ATP-binding protein